MRWSAWGSRVHGTVQVFQPVLPLPPALLREAQTVSSCQEEDDLEGSPSHLVFLELLVLRVVGGKLQSTQRAGVGLQVSHRGEGGVSEVGRGRGLA